MKIAGIPFSTIDWSKVEVEEHKGKTGSAFLKTNMCEGICVGMIYLIIEPTLNTAQNFL